MRTAIIVLGFPSTRKGGPHPVQRWRVRRGVKLFSKAADGWLIFTGGATRGAKESEAAVMGRYATEVLGVPADRVEVEEQATSTWENVLFSIPMAEARGATTFVFASDFVHTARARRYLRRQRPDLFRDQSASRA